MDLTSTTSRKNCDLDQKLLYLISFKFSKQSKSRLYCRLSKEKGYQRISHMPDKVINDINIRVATVNGTGSQSSNLVIMRAIFNMGVPVCGKNQFPSNIAGLPTWYTIRVSAKGYKTSKKHADILIAMNKDTVLEDIAELPAGSVFIYNNIMKIDEHLRVDHFNYGVPFNKLVGEVTDNVKLKKLVVNMVYVGVLAELIKIDRDAMRQALEKQFSTKPKAVELNMKAIDAGMNYVKENIEKRDLFYLEPMDKTSGHILIEGNAATALGALMGGCTVMGWYPITPSSSVCENLIKYAEKYRKDPDTGEVKFAAIQAEDELASIGMVIGASWAGARAMTATAGPGMSLMSEIAGLGYGAEIPAVIVNVQRMGPTTGLPTRTSQGDILSSHYLSHGDTMFPVLLPASVEECYEFGMEVFDLAEQYQTPVFLLSDLDLGMNLWMTKPFKYPEKPYNRGKVLTAEDLEKMEHFYRYMDVDGDGIPYRTVPGTDSEKAAYFTRGSGHNAKGKYTEKAGEWQEVIERLVKKMDTIRPDLPQSILSKGNKESKVGLIAYGTTHWAIEEAREILNEKEVYFDYLRMRALPVTQDVKDFIASYDKIYVVEQNRDAQMTAILKLELEPQYIERLVPVLNYDGDFIDAYVIADQLLKKQGQKEVAHV